MNKVCCKNKTYDMCSEYRKHLSSTINSYTLEFIPQRQRKWRKPACHGTQCLVPFRTKGFKATTEETDLAPSPTSEAPVSAPGPTTSQIPSQAAQEGEQGDRGTHIPVGTVTAPAVSRRALTAPRRYPEQGPYPPLHASSILSPLGCNSLLPIPQMQPSDHRAFAHAGSTLE